MLRKVVLTLLTIFCLSFASLLRCHRISVDANPTTWTVDDDGPADFNNIQEAINNANSSDTILVRNGTYYENLIVNKTVSLIGENMEATIIDGGGAGNVISITGVNNVSIQGFTIRRSGMSPPGNGILVAHSAGNDISNNKIRDNSEGIYLYFSSSNIVKGNLISVNNDGISLFSSSDNVVSDNIINSSNYDGIYLSASNDNVFSRNIILYDGNAGMSLYYSSSNVIYSNTVSNNYYGISLSTFSSNNSIYHNNFSNNTAQVWSVLQNFWDRSDGGNYWSDYEGQDLNEDGMGDSPYYIDEINQDKRPLMGIFYDFEIIMEREAHYVAIVSNSTISDFRFEIGAETGNRIVHFNVTCDSDALVFSRVAIPIKLMKGPYIALVDGKEVTPTVLNITDEESVYLYFTYLDKSYTISIISSEVLNLYYELLARYEELQNSFDSLNATYYDLLTNYTSLQGNLYDLNATYYSLLTGYEKLQNDLYDLNVTYYSLLGTSTTLLGNLYILNVTYHALFSEFSKLLGNYSELQRSFNDVNASYQEHMLDYSEQIQNLRNLMYIFVATTAIFIITTIYLSKQAHGYMKTKT